MGRDRVLLTVKFKNTCKRYNCMQLQLDGGKIFCTICSTRVEFTEAKLVSSIKQHVNTSSHKSNLNKQPQELISNAINKKQIDETNEAKFKRELTNAFSSADICLSKLENPELKKFISDWTKQKVPHSKTLRHNYVQPRYEEIVRKIREKIGENYVYFGIDETTDASKQFVVNVMVGLLNGTTEKPMCFKYLIR